MTTFVRSSDPKVATDILISVYSQNGDGQRFTELDNNVISSWYPLMHLVVSSPVGPKNSIQDNLGIGDWSFIWPWHFRAFVENKSGCA